MSFVTDLYLALDEFREKNAFFIDERYYTYGELGELVLKIRHVILNNTSQEEKVIGLIVGNNLFTYASIIALWFEGRAFVALNPKFPKERNELIMNSSDIKSILDYNGDSPFKEKNIISFEDVTKDVGIKRELIKCSLEDLVYIIFTSGTTGTPKGVPTNRLNLDTFLKSLWDMGYEIDEKDRCLQFAELTFDFSIVNFLPPLIKGACVYTIPENKMKFAYVYRLLEKFDLSVIMIVPSLLQYLRPYFEELNFPSLRYSMFGGESVPIDLIEDWMICAPNSRIYNVYGPTENTIYSTIYEYKKGEKDKSLNGILCIGKPVSGTSYIILNKKGELIQDNMDQNEGELCLGGNQLTRGYLNDPKRNKKFFKEFDVNGETKLFYKTGDLVRIDHDGDMLYLGRIDHQVQIQGFRVEMSEIEFHTKDFIKDRNFLVVPQKDLLGSTQIILVIEGEEMEKKPVFEHLSGKLPDYMVPKKICFFETLPLSINGKIDRNTIIKMTEKI